MRLTWEWLSLVWLRCQREESKFISWPLQLNLGQSLCKCLNSIHSRLALSFGHDHIGDGLRLSVPSYVHIGMLSCYEEVTPAISPEIKAFVESQAAIDNGVIVVAFGTLVGRSRVYLSYLFFYEVAWWLSSKTLNRFLITWLKFSWTYSEVWPSKLFGNGTPDRTTKYLKMSWWLTGYLSRPCSPTTIPGCSLRMLGKALPKSHGVMLSPR